MRGTTHERFNAKYVVDKKTGCWPWQAGLSNGYASFSWDGGTMGHRYSYAYFVGPLVADMTVDHLCNNKACVNPEHLELVTIIENVQRAYRRRGFEVAA